MTIIECEDRIRSHMELCLAIKLNKAMTAKNGPKWFDQLVQEDAEIRLVDKDKVVLQNKHKKLEDCDFQAICKILCFREAYRKATFLPFSDKEDSKQLALLYNILDFRNAVLAHKKVLTPKVFAAGEYSYENAILDMMSILRIFKGVTGPAPKPKDRPDAEDVTVCYYDEAKKIFEQYKKENGQVDYPVAKALALSGLGVTEDEFINACNELGLDTFRPKGEGWCFSSKEPEKDIQHICEHFKQKAIAQKLSNEKIIAQNSARDVQKKANEMAQKSRLNTRKTLLIFIILIAIAAAIILSITFTKSNDTDSDSNNSGVNHSQNDKQSSDDQHAEPDNENENKQNSTTQNQTTNNDSTQLDEKIQAEIDNFASTGLNTFNLKVGENHKPTAAVWLNGGSAGSCYSLNEDVVTVAVNGTVTAIAEGETFVVYEASSSMYAVYKYVVKGQYQTQDQLIQSEIDNFAPDSFNDVQLKKGQTHKPTSAVWLSGGSSGNCYSTDTAVVTVAANGTVTAVGDGQAFVVIQSGSMYTVTRYTVSGEYKTEDQLIQEEIDNFVPDAFNNITLKIGATHKHTSAVWLNGGQGTCYSTNPDVVSVSDNGLVTAIGTGEAFVVIKAGGGMHSIIRYTVVE